MTKNNALIILILTFIFGISNAQEITDSTYRYKYIFSELSGLRDKSAIFIHETFSDNSNSANFIGNIFWIRKIEQDSINAENSDTATYITSTARLVLRNKKLKIDTILDEIFAISIPVGRYKMTISKVGKGFINRNIRIRQKKIYKCEIHLKSRRSISQYRYNCKSKMTHKDYKSIKRHYKSPEKHDIVEPSCDCIIEIIFFD